MKPAWSESLIFYWYSFILILIVIPIWARYAASLEVTFLYTVWIQNELLVLWTYHPCPTIEVICRLVLKGENLLLPDSIAQHGHACVCAGGSWEAKGVTCFGLLWATSQICSSQFPWGCLWDWPRCLQHLHSVVSLYCQERVAGSNLPLSSCPRVIFGSDPT